MNRLLIAPLLLLTACAPALQAVQRESASLSRDGQAIVFRNPGPDAAEVVGIRLRGDLKTEDANCAPRPGSKALGCVIPEVPAGQQYRVAFTGTLEGGSVFFYRASSGERPIYLTLP